MTEFHISLTGSGDLAAQIYQQLLNAIRDGTLRAGERLPPTRELAARLKVARNTVAGAYDRLTAEGLLVARVGAGTFVGQVQRTRRRQAPSGSVQPRQLWRELATFAPTGETPRFDFRVGIPDPRLFPTATWRRLVAQSISPTVGYIAAEGPERLRAAIARYIGQARSVRASPEDVLVTQGAQQALDLIGRVLIEPGAQVAVEEPGYPPARLLFRSLGARIEPVPVDAEGIVVQAIPRGVSLVYTTPSHQFPLGMPMSLARRTALLDWAWRSGAVIVEDDYDTEYRFADRPLAPLQSLDRDGRVIYVGSFSKTLLPSLRAGFLIAPATLQPALRTARQLADWHGDVTTQNALARFIEEGLLARHIRKSSAGYLKRRTLILEILERDFADHLDVVASVAGLHLTAHLHPNATVDWEALQDQGVGVGPLSRFCARKPLSGLVIGYGAIRPDLIPEGLRLLRLAIAGPGATAPDPW